MDSVEAKAAIRRLTRGKSVDAYFDLGEDDAAQAFIRKVFALGLHAELHGDEEESWLGSRPRPRVIKCAVVGFLGFWIWFWFFMHRPHAAITRVLTVMLGVLFVSLFIIVEIRDRRTRTPEQEEREQKLRIWQRLWLPALAVLTGIIIAEPWLGIALLALAAVGIVCAVIIRVMNRRD